MGVYPFQSWNKWLMLTSRISKAEMERLQPTDKWINAATEMLPEPRRIKNGDNAEMLAEPSQTNTENTTNTKPDLSQTIAENATNSTPDSSRTNTENATNTPPDSSQANATNTLSASIHTNTENAINSSRTNGGAEDADEGRLPRLVARPGTQPRYTPLPRHRYPAGCGAAEITKHNLDSTYQLEEVISQSLWIASGI